MTNAKNRGEIYKCSVCGNMVEVLFVGGGELVCCEKPMELQKEMTEDEGLEKHVPVIEQDGNVYTVKVGQVPHPMQEDHYIQWIQLLADGKSYRKFLEPDEKPEAEFIVDDEGEDVSAREYCNVHGLWKSDQ